LPREKSIDRARKIGKNTAEAKGFEDNKSLAKKQ
jgi:hypothetical protein